jgi:urease accessory protein
MESLLLLADGRFPGGGYAHSGGLEAAVAGRAVHDLTTLAEYVRGRLYTAGALEAWASAQASSVVSSAGTAAPALVQFDGEIDARTLSPVLRKASRTLGRGLRRSATSVWAEAADIAAEHQPVVLGAVAALAGRSPLDAAYLSVHHHVMGVVSAAPKLMAVDTADAMGIVARVAADCDAVATDAAAPDADPPPWTAALVDVRSVEHAQWEVRLFAS